MSRPCRRLARERAQVYDFGVVEQPHARFYRGLPPVVRPRRWRRLIVGAVFVGPVVSGIVLLAVTLTRGYCSAPSGYHGGGGNPYGLGFPSWGELGSFGIAIGIPLIVGGVLGVALARGWWSMVAVDAVGLALMLWAFSGGGLAPWFLMVIGVSAGLGVRGLMQRRRIVQASFLSHPA